MTHSETPLTVSWRPTDTVRVSRGLLGGLRFDRLWERQRGWVEYEWRRCGLPLHIKSPVTP